MKVVAIYGTECNANTAWFPYLKSELDKMNICCNIPNLPTPNGQTYNNWSNIVNKLEIRNDDIVVGWSTGAIFAVRYLYENNIIVKKLILVSGFNNYIGNVPKVDKINKDFFMKDLSKAKNVAKEIVCIKSDNDPFITQEALDEFAKKLDSKLINIKNGGHFNQSSGYNTFKELIEQILN